MKKTLIASSLAVGLGVVAGNAGHDAHASEADLNKAALAQMAQSNDQSLNENPIEAGAYNYTFDYEGFTYHFESDGTHFSWEYHATGATNKDVSSQASTATNETASSQVGATQQANNVQPQQVSAPQNAQTNAPQTTAVNETSQQDSTEQQSTQSSNDTQQATKQQSSQANSSDSKADSGSSVNVNSHLQQIAQRESGGNIHAVNPSSGAAGKYQFLQSTWDSVAPSEYKGVSPAKAPESVQDAAAVKLYNTGGPGHWVTA